MRCYEHPQCIGYATCVRGKSEAEQSASFIKLDTDSVTRTARKACWYDFNAVPQWHDGRCEKAGFCVYDGKQIVVQSDGTTVDAKAPQSKRDRSRRANDEPKARRKVEGAVDVSNTRRFQMRSRPARGTGMRPEYQKHPHLPPGSTSDRDDPALREDYRYLADKAPSRYVMVEALDGGSRGRPIVIEAICSTCKKDNRCREHGKVKSKKHRDCTYKADTCSAIHRS